MMIHDSHRRLVTAHGVLAQLLVSNVHPKLETFRVTWTPTALLTAEQGAHVSCLLYSCEVEISISEFGVVLLREKEALTDVSNTAHSEPLVRHSCARKSRFVRNAVGAAATPGSRTLLI